MRSFLAVALLFASATLASATIIIQENPGNLDADVENVLFNGTGTNQTGNPLIGRLNQANALVNFDSVSDGSLTAQQNGQGQGGAAFVEGDFTDLTFNMRDFSLGFTAAVFNLNSPNRSGNQDPNTVLFNIGWVNPVAGTSGETAVSSPYDLGNGQNFFRVTAIDNQIITFVNLRTEIALEDIRQVRIGGVTPKSGQPGGDPGGEVPEPMSMSLMAGGVLGLWFYRKSRVQG